MATSYSVQDPSQMKGLRISEVLFDRMERRFGTLAELPTNVEAIDAALLFATGLNPFVALVGPSGWGKTHLMECASNHLLREFRVQTQVTSAADWLHGKTSLDTRQPILIDDVHDVVAKTRTRNQLRLLLERRVKIGLPTMLSFTGDRPTRQHLSFLPSFREWRVTEMGEPSPKDRAEIVRYMAKGEGMQMSDMLAKLIGTKMKGNGNTIHGALVRLKTGGLRWQGSEEILRACGILDKFFADNPDWDLKETIAIAADRTAIRFPDVTKCELACFGMISVAQLGELDAARFCGIEPAKARRHCIRFQDRMSSLEKTRFAYTHFLELVVENLPTG